MSDKVANFRNFYTIAREGDKLVLTVEEKVLVDMGLVHSYKNPRAALEGLVAPLLQVPDRIASTFSGF